MISVISASSRTILSHASAVWQSQYFTGSYKELVPDSLGVNDTDFSNCNHKLWFASCKINLQFFPKNFKPFFLFYFKNWQEWPFWWRSFDTSPQTQTPTILKNFFSGKKIRNKRSTRIVKSETTGQEPGVPQNPFGSNYIFAPRAKWMFFLEKSSTTSEGLSHYFPHWSSLLARVLLHCTIGSSRNTQQPYQQNSPHPTSTLSTESPHPIAWVVRHYKLPIGFKLTIRGSPCNAFHVNPYIMSRNLKYLALNPPVLFRLLLKTQW